VPDVPRLSTAEVPGFTHPTPSAEHMLSPLPADIGMVGNDDDDDDDDDVVVVERDRVWEEEIV